MTTSHSPDWLVAAVSAVRDVMLKRLEAPSLDAQAKREMEMAVDALDMMWEELQGQAALLVREHERYSEFFQYAPDGYFITDAGGNVREVNEAALELLRAPQGEVLGKALSEFIAADDRVNFLARTVGPSSVKPLNWRARVQPHEGVPFLAEFSLRAIPLKKSGVGGLCWLMRPAA
jgi:PAS domain S-box-containing protein